MSETLEKMPPVPVDITPDRNTGNFELINSLFAYNKVPVYEYKSRITGLSVIVAEVEGPIVDGFFCLATEAFDDDGLPHTLEHLIFLGSEDYPYKGVLDLLANRCLASGTNAWTDTDHTCYTMETAGSDGFLALMPIFLDHILYPILTDSGFVTEVHHITPEGDDAGVVYCEMQGRENSAESRLHLTMARALYPGRCGYSSETGGIMKNLRESTNNEKVRNFHKEFYRPENLKIIITGQINHSKIFQALAGLETKIQAKGERGTFVRPWQSPVAPLEKSEDIEINFPSDEESNGLYAIAWRGPSAVKEQYELVALGLLLKYLTEHSTYTLPKAFVEIDDPYASDVSYNVIENSVSAVYISFQNVPLDKLSKIKPKLMEIFQEILEKEDINMERMENVIQHNKLELLSNLESNPGVNIAFMIIGHVLYGNTKQDFDQRLNPVADHDKLLLEPKSFWLNLMRKYMVDNKYISVQCKPSKSEHERMAQEEADRVAKQVETLGEEGLKKVGKILSDAIEFNEREPPKTMLTSLPIPSFRSINFHNITRYRTDFNNKNNLIDLENTPVYTCFDDVKSEFVTIYALLDTRNLNPELRKYLPLLLESLFESPVRGSGDTIIPYEEVIERLNKDTLYFGATIGVGGTPTSFKADLYSHHILVNLQLEASKYPKGILWLTYFLYNVIFSEERLKIIAARMKNTLSQTKRSGRNAVKLGMQTLRYIEDSNVRSCGLLEQSKFLSDILEILQSDRASEVVSTCTQIWKQLTKPDNIVLHFMGNLSKIEHPEKQLALFLPADLQPKQSKLFVTPEYMLLKKDNPKVGYFIGMACLESSFFCQTVDSITSYEDPHLPALMLYLQYLIQAEGPMWRRIRGKGLSYGYYMVVHPNDGLLYMAFTKATNVVGAYTEAREIILEQISKKEWDQNLIESAKSSLIFELIEKEKNIGNVIELSLLSYFHKIDYVYNRNLLGLIFNVTIDDLNSVGEKYLQPLFDPLKVKTAIASVPAKADATVEAFKSFNIHLESYSSLEDSFLKCEH